MLADGGNPRDSPNSDGRVSTETRSMTNAEARQFVAFAAVFKVTTGLSRVLDGNRMTFATGSARRCAGFRRNLT